ncbi:MAG TPA: tetratricopeptide repeat protein, partial [Pirellulales bacterium]
VAQGPPPQNSPGEIGGSKPGVKVAQVATAQPTVRLAQPLGVDNRVGLEALPDVAVEQLPQPLAPDCVATALRLPAATVAQAAPQWTVAKTPNPRSEASVALASDAGPDSNATHVSQSQASTETGLGIALVGDSADGPVVPASASTAIDDSVPGHDGRARLARVEQELQDFPGDADRYLQRARIHADAGRTEDALADANAALRLAPANADAFLLRAEIYVRLERFDAALVDYERAIELMPGSSRGYCLRARLWVARGEWHQAIADYDAALRLNPRLADAYCHRGFAWLRLGNQDQSKADFTAAIALEPEHCPAMLGRAQVNRLQGNPQAALTELDRALYIDPRFAAAYVERSLCNVALGRHDRARADRAQATELTAG